MDAETFVDLAISRWVAENEDQLLQRYTQENLEKLYKYAADYLERMKNEGVRVYDYAEVARLMDDAVESVESLGLVPQIPQPEASPEEAQATAEAEAERQAAEARKAEYAAFVERAHTSTIRQRAQSDPAFRAWLNAQKRAEIEQKSREARVPSVAYEFGVKKAAPSQETPKPWKLETTNDVVGGAPPLNSYGLKCSNGEFLVSINNVTGAVRTTPRVIHGASLAAAQEYQKELKKHGVNAMIVNRYGEVIG